ncbi:MAG TPA: ABC transporter ATP-binding protein [Streptosporangiaceae bacterium]|nr:ABC transporter ATP-binding protein [Streptosporangiaceae bacterium]
MTGPAPALADTKETQVPLLEARGLTKHFALRSTRLNPRGGVVHAACDIDLAVPAGGITAIVGESGSGKSTLARLLARLIKPTSGELFLDGQQLRPRGLGTREYARAVQLVLQDPFSSLNPIHDVRYHLTRPLKVHKLADGGATGNGLEDAIDTLLGKVSLTPAELFAAKYPHELSGGQRQRVAIARALAVEPRLLLADEPVSMLDVSIRLGVLNLLGDLRDRDGLAIVYVTHDIASARYLADEIAVMYAGRVVEQGPAPTVTDQPAHPYTELLLSAAPDPSRARSASLRGKGAAPNLVAPPPGCRFHPRCPHAMAVCATTVPVMTRVTPGHQTACWLHASGLTEAQKMPLASRPAGSGEEA